MDKKGLIKAKKIGEIGENYAANYLLASGYSILTRNFHSRFGEIDIVAEKTGVIFFIEVKTRKNLNFGYPEDSLTAKKLLRIKKTVYSYFNECPCILCKSWQIDLIAITLNSFDEVKNMVHYKNVLET